MATFTFALTAQSFKFLNSPPTVKVLSSGKSQAIKFRPEPVYLITNVKLRLNPSSLETGNLIWGFWQAGSLKGTPLLPERY